MRSEAIENGFILREYSYVAKAQRALQFTRFINWNLVNSFFLKNPGWVHFSGRVAFGKHLKLIWIPLFEDHKISINSPRRTPPTGNWFFIPIPSRSFENIESFRSEQNCRQQAKAGIYLKTCFVKLHIEWIPFLEVPWKVLKMTFFESTKSFQNITKRRKEFSSTPQKWVWNYYLLLTGTKL